MKKFYYSLLVALLFSIPALANNVVVKGYITYSNGSPAVNHSVWIMTDSSTTAPACMQAHQVHTNANGFYMDSLNCPNGAIVKVRIQTENCNGTVLVENVQVNTATNIVERNFTLACNPSCHADFIFTKQNLVVAFQSTATVSGSTPISHYWNFGDGSTSTLANPLHTYPAAGTYIVKLIIGSNGCYDSVAKSITLTNAAGTCHAQFSDSMIAPNKYIFNSTASTTASGDQIINRVWSFGDGTGNGNNQAVVDHIYQQSGTYNVCLKIISANGCIDSTCKTITATVTPPACHANFNYNVGTAGAVFFTNTSNTLGTTAQYVWSFGNLATSSGINAVFTFPPGTYNVCLRVYANNCMDSICKTIVIAPPPPPTNCEAVFQYTGLPATLNGYTLQFTSSQSHATSAANDTIHERIWIWGDGTTTGGNIVSPVHNYTSPAVYNVCLVIRSSSGCSDTTCKTVTVPMPNQVTCQSKFTYEHLPATSTTGKPVKFNSSTSTAGYGDSIISRKWTFGDGTSLMTGNTVMPVHVYQLPGTYNACLTITTALGCTKTECKLIVVPQVANGCVPHFTWIRTGPKQATFNSSSSWVPVGDSIIERKWQFGDATPLLGGNIVSPVHNYLNNGIYTVTLKIITAQHCEKTFYGVVPLQDSINTNPNQDRIRIVTLYPIPATFQMQAVVWSLQNNIQAELAVYDIYGTKKWSTNKLLLSGNNVTVIPTGFLAPGPYYFRVTTIFGVKSKPFFKQ